MYKDREIIYFVKKVDEDILRIELGRKKLLEKFIPADKEFHLEVDQTYPHITIYINKNSQILYIEDNKKVISFSVATEYLQEIINRNLEEESYKIILSPISSVPEFWKYIENEDLMITEVSFDLLAPNFLSANSKAREIAKQLHDNNNAERFCIRLISETGLIIREEFSSYVDYTSDGAGTWSIRAVNKKNLKKFIYTQKEKVKKTRVSITDDNDKITLEIQLLKSIKSDGDISEKID